MTSPTSFEDPRKTILGVLEDNWNAANTPDAGTPNFATEWVNAVDDERPLITVTGRDETPLAASGYHAVRGDGSGVSQRKRGFVLVNCWAEVRDPGSIGSDPNPKDQAEQMWQEVERIILARADGTGDLEMLRTDGPLETTAERESQTTHRLHGRIDYEYQLTP